MTKINISVSGSAATATVDGYIGEHMIGIQVKATFDDAWAGLTPVLIAHCGRAAQPMIVDHDGVCTVPWEILHRGYDLQISIYGVDQDGNRGEVTVWATCGKVLQTGLSVYDPSDEPEPTPALVDQIVAMVGRADRNAANAAEAAENAEEAAGQAEIHAQNAANSAAKAARDAGSAENQAKQAALFASQSAEDAARASGSASAAASSASAAVAAANRAAADAQNASTAAGDALREAEEANTTANDALDAAGVATQVAQAAQRMADARYIKPSGGIPESDLDAEVRDKLNNGGVTSINGKTGEVQLGAGDVGAVALPDEIAADELLMFDRNGELVSSGLTAADIATKAELEEAIGGLSDLVGDGVIA